ncbi:YidB family protein [Methylobacterium tarhaniae]|uniref:YidB family protein n=1 Tax=Methylobacterium tarhaniae TaxID=1187852 RepID=UPI003D046ABC
MGLLDQVIGSVLGNVLGGGSRHEGRHDGGSGAMSPLVKALLMLLAAKAMQGGFGDIFGGGRRPAPQGGPDDGYAPDPHGYDMPTPRDEAPRGRTRRDEDPDNPYSDLAGMLDGPGGGTRAPSPAGGGMQNPFDQDSFDQGAGPYSRLDREQPDDAAGGGLDHLVDRFRQGGLGELIESWIGPGHNRPIQPQQLAQALGPETVDTLSRQTGLGRDDLLAQLAQVLPGVIDGLTPQGRRPNHDEMRGW